MRKTAALFIITECRPFLKREFAGKSRFRLIVIAVGGQAGQFRLAGEAPRELSRVQLPMAGAAGGR